MRTFIQLCLLSFITFIFSMGVWINDVVAESVITGISMNKSLPVRFKNYGYKVVIKKDGHPVRSDKKSMRFEVRAGDCSIGKNGGWDDCEHDRERHELKQKGRGTGYGETWYHWSIYFPENHPIIYPAKLALGQFKIGTNKAAMSGPPMFMFQNKDGGYYVDNQVVGATIEKIKILSDAEVRGNWSDILINVNWTPEQDGFFTVYVNGETKPRYHWTGPTIKSDKYKYVSLKMGIYRSYVSRTPEDDETQIIYYDDVAKSKKCRKVTEYFDCKKILSLRSTLEIKSALKICNGKLCAGLPDRVSNSMGGRFSCWLSSAKLINLDDLPIQTDIDALIANIEGTGKNYRLSKRQLHKHANQAPFIKTHSRSLLRLVNYSGTNEDFCAKPIL